MTPGVWILVLWLGHISRVHVLKTHYLCKILLLRTQAQINQTESIVVVIEKGSTKIVNLVTSWSGVFVLGRSQMVIYRVVKMQLIFFLSFLLWGKDQTNYVYNNYDQETVFQKIVNLMTPGQGVLMQVCEGVGQGQEEFKIMCYLLTCTAH